MSVKNATTSPTAARKWVTDELAEFTDEQWNYLFSLKSNTKAVITMSTEPDKTEEFKYAANNETQIAEMRFSRDERGNYNVSGYKVKPDGSRGDIEFVKVDDESLDIVALKMARKLGMTR